MRLRGIVTIDEDELLGESGSGERVDPLSCHGDQIALVIANVVVDDDGGIEFPAARLERRADAGDGNGPVDSLLHPVGEALVHLVELTGGLGLVEPRLDDREQIGLDDRPGLTHLSMIDRAARIDRGRARGANEDREGGKESDALHRIACPVPTSRSRHTNPICA